MNSKILSLNLLRKKLIKNKKKKVLCHGVFDLIHLGHIRHLEAAKKRAEILIVNLTPDKFIKKGPNRPYFTLEQRLESIASLKCVDYVTWNNQESASDVILNLKPNFYCKGQDYKKIKEDVTGKIKTEINAIKKVKGKIIFTDDIVFSSTQLINDNFKLLNNDQQIIIERVKKKYSLKDLNAIFEKIKKLKVGVIGELIIDIYAFGEALGKSGKEPIMMIKNINEEKYLGGTGAIANHLSSFVQKIDLFAMIGEKKEYFNFIKNNLKKNISSNFYLKNKSPTIIKKRYLDHVTKNKIIGFYTINDDSIEKKYEINLLNKISKNLNKNKINIVSDYGHGMITEKVKKIINSNRNFVAINTQVNAANTATFNLKKYHKVDLVMINEKELRNELRNNSENINVLIRKLSNVIKSKYMVITRGTKGAIMYNFKKNKFFNCPAFATKVLDRVGSGDSMLAILSVFLYLTKDEELSLLIGSIVAAEKVQNIGNKYIVEKKNILKILSHLLN
jgi:rfaE bifunctional protein kinase chain/domain